MSAFGLELENQVAQIGLGKGNAATRFHRRNCRFSNGMALRCASAAIHRCTPHRRAGELRPRNRRQRRAGQTLYKKPLYNTVTDFTPVILIAEAPLVLITRKDLPVNNFKEFVAYAKEHQARMQFGSAGAGSATHLGCVNYLLGLKITHVPYRGTGPAMQDLQSGRIDFLCDVMTTAKPPIDGGSVKGLAVFDSKRSSALPNVCLPPPRKAHRLSSPIPGTPSSCRRARQSRSSRHCTMRHLWRCIRPAVHDRLTAFGAEIVSDDEATPDTAKSTN